MPEPWLAPSAQAPINATVVVPGSKSQTNRALVLAALSSGPSVITHGLQARDTQLMREALRTLGVTIDESGEAWQVRPPETFTGGGTILCGLAGTVMRFVPPLAALADAPVAFDFDLQARVRPMAPLLDALVALGVGIDGDPASPPFRVHGSPSLAGGQVEIAAAASSQFVSGLLLIGARLAGGLDLRHVGESLPSRQHIDMTVAMLAERGVEVDTSEENRWVVAPGRIAPRDVLVEPDIANAAPFLAAAAVTGGRVTVPNWPSATDQPARQLLHAFGEFGVETSRHEGSLTVHGVDQLAGVDLDLRDASELTPVVAALACLADHTSHVRGVAHIRGHETDRLAALETELDRLGAHVSQTRDGLTIHPRLLGGATFRTYADHRMAHAAAVLGLVVEDMVLDDVSCTGKTMPGFVDLWSQMLADSQEFSDRNTPPEEVE